MLSVDGDKDVSLMSCKVSICAVLKDRSCVGFGGPWCLIATDSLCMPSEVSEQLTCGNDKIKQKREQARLLGRGTVRRQTS